MSVQNPICAKIDVAALLKGCNGKRNRGANHHDTDIKDGLCGRARNRGAADMLDRKDGKELKAFLEGGFDERAERRPLWVVVFYGDTY